MDVRHAIVINEIGFTNVRYVVVINEFAFSTGKLQTNSKKQTLTDYCNPSGLM